MHMFYNKDMVFQNSVPFKGMFLAQSAPIKGRIFTKFIPIDDMVNFLIPMMGMDSFHVPVISHVNIACQFSNPV